jgi:hypothetical protein
VAVTHPGTNSIKCTWLNISSWIRGVIAPWEILGGGGAQNTFHSSWLGDVNLCKGCADIRSTDPPRYDWSVIIIPPVHVLVLPSGWEYLSRDHPCLCGCPPFESYPFRNCSFIQAVYSAHLPWFLAYSDQKYKKYKIFYEYAYWTLFVLKHKINQYKYIFEYVTPLTQVSYHL